MVLWIMVGWSGWSLFSWFIGSFWWKLTSSASLTRGDALTSPFVLETIEEFVGTVVAYQIWSACLISCVFVVCWSPNCFLFFLFHFPICSKNKIKQWKSIPWLEFACSQWEAEHALKRDYLFPLGRGGEGEEFYYCCVLILFPCVPNDLSTCFPWALCDAPQVPNEFPKGFPNSSSLVWGQFLPSQLYRWAKGEGLHPLRNFSFGEVSQVSSFCFFGDERVKMMRGKKTKKKQNKTTIEKQSICWIE